MIALDTDVFSEILAGSDEYIAGAAAVPEDELCITVVTAEETLRGLLAELRRAEAGRTRRPLGAAYERLWQVLVMLARWRIVGYSAAADAQFCAWRAAKIPGGTHDLRIAAICVSGAITLVSRNRKDFEKVPGLAAEFWK